MVSILIEQKSYIVSLPLMHIRLSIMFLDKKSGRYTPLVGVVYLPDP